MAIKKNNISLFSCIICLLFTSCNDVWSTEEKSDYIEDCLAISGATDKQCECSFNIFSKEYSYIDFAPRYKEINKSNYSKFDVKEVEIINEEIRKCFTK